MFGELQSLFKFVIAIESSVLLSSFVIPESVKLSGEVISLNMLNGGMTELFV